VKDEVSQGLEGGAAHSNTQGKGNESIDSLLGYREDTEGEGGRSGTKGDRRRNLGSWGLPSAT